MNINQQQKKYLELLDEKINSPNLTLKKQAYYKRMKKLLWLRDLSREEWHPVNMVADRILKSDFYKNFDTVITPEIVWEYETFDLFNFPKEHVARRESDSYFINKSQKVEQSVLLRPHTSVMWYHYLWTQWWKEKLQTRWEVQALSWWKVYRVDELDTTHHECFHQIDWLRIVKKEKEQITQQTLKDVLSQTIISVYWPGVEYRFHTDSFPYTTESLEVEIKDWDSWVEVLWAGIVHSWVLLKLWIDPAEYNWWAFGFWIDRLAMKFKEIPDIRILWSDDERITNQWWNFEPYVVVSSYPLIQHDISFVVNKHLFVLDTETMQRSEGIELQKQSEQDWFKVTSIAREVWEWLIEEMKIIDIYENDKVFWVDKKSISIRIIFRSLERTLTNDEINTMYISIREKIETELWYELR